MFRFTIRELLLLTLVVAMGVAWFRDSRHRQAETERVQEANERIWKDYAEFVGLIPPLDDRIYSLPIKTGVQRVSIRLRENPGLPKSERREGK